MIIINDDVINLKQRFVVIFVGYNVFDVVIFGKFWMFVVSFLYFDIYVNGCIVFFIVCCEYNSNVLKYI